LDLLTSAIACRTNYNLKQNKARGCPHMHWVLLLKHYVAPEMQQMFWA